MALSTFVGVYLVPTMQELDQDADTAVQGADGVAEPDTREEATPHGEDAAYQQYE